MHQLYDNDGDAERQLRAIASDVLRDQTVIGQLVERVGLSQAIPGEKPPGSEKAQE